MQSVLNKAQRFSSSALSFENPPSSPWFTFINFTSIVKCDEAEQVGLVDKVETAFGKAHEERPGFMNSPCHLCNSRGIQHSPMVDTL